MSVTAMAAVFRHSRSTGAARLMLLAIADSAHDSGELSAYPRSQTLLAAKANVDARTARRALRTLEDLGELKVTQVGDGRASSDYQMLLPGLANEGGQDARPARAPRPPREGRMPAPSSRPSPSLPVNETAVPPADAGRQGTLAGLPEPAVSPSDPAVKEASELVARVWENRSPRPAAKFVALMQIARRLLEAGHTAEAVEAAFMAAPAFTIAALEFQLNGGRQHRGAETRSTSASNPELRGRWTAETFHNA